MSWIFVRIALVGDSNKYPQHMFLWKNRERKRIFITYHTVIFGASLWRQILFNSRILGEKCCRYNEVFRYTKNHGWSLFLYEFYILISFCHTILISCDRRHKHHHPLLVNRFREVQLNVHAFFMLYWGHVLIFYNYNNNDLIYREWSTFSKLVLIFHVVR